MRFLRLLLPAGVICWAMAAWSQAAPQVEPPPVAWPLVVPPVTPPKPMILQAVVPEDVATSSEQSGLVEMFPWDVIESSVEGTRRFPLSVPRRPMPLPKRELRGVVIPAPRPPEGSITIWTTPPRPAAESRGSHLDRVIRKALESPPPRK